MINEFFGVYFKRLKNRKILFLLPILLILCGMSGIGIGKLYEGDSSPLVSLFYIYTAFSQLTFLFLTYIYNSEFCSDFSKKIYPFFSQLGISTTKQILIKFTSLMIISIFTCELFFIICNFIFSNTNYEYLILLLISIALTLVYTVSFSLMISLIVKNTTISYLICFGSFVLFNFLNLVCYGLFSPADGNSLTTTTLKALSGQEIIHKSLLNPSINLASKPYLFTMISPLVLIVLIWIINLIFLRKISKNYL